ncbi:MAG: hypothetical protein ACE5FS_13230 [Paracoccaceae bacterium]
MFALFVFQVLAALATGGLALIAIRGTAGFPAKLAALALLAGIVGLGYTAFAELLGRPKPARFEWLASFGEEVPVIASLAVEDEAIYLWLQLPEDDGAPRGYRLPYSLENAKKLQQARREAERRHGTYSLRRNDGEWVFSAKPPPPLPPKPDS